LADFVDSTVKDIDRRLSELKVEVSKLEAARTALVGGRRGPGRPASANNASSTTRRRATRRPGRPRGRRGGNTRANQALALVQEKPGITIPQIAEALKIEPNYLYRVMPKLVEDGQVTREGQGWHPAAAK
jgi:Winged helix-turn-helix DNA-binding